MHIIDLHVQSVERAYQVKNFYYHKAKILTRRLFSYF